MSPISNLPIKGTSDWFPDEFRKRKFIFDTWRDVCTSFGYREYLTPLVEYSSLYKAKSGNEVGGTELTTFIDRGERELAIRPEMTPSVSRMVSRIISNEIKPLRFFSIANFFRNEKPQRGRNREFWQLNCDIFGSYGYMADVESIKLSIEIMKAFKAPAGSFTVYVNDKNLLIQGILNVINEKNEESETISKILRLIDKYRKISSDDFDKLFLEIINDQDILQRLKLTLSAKTIEDFVEITSLKNITSSLKDILNELEVQGYIEFVKFSPLIVRGLDYYDGMVFEVYSNGTTVNRALFGGGRYNSLSTIFGVSNFPAVGFAPGDETTYLFLEELNLFPVNNIIASTYFVPILSKKASKYYSKIAAELRYRGEIVIEGLDEIEIGKAIEYSNRIKANYCIILGDRELKDNQYLVKDMSTGEQQGFDLL